MSSDILWKPTPAFTKSTNFHKYSQWLAKNRNKKFTSYAAFHRWSISDMRGFWKSIYEFYKVIDHAAPRRTLARRAGGMIGTRWFPGSEVSYSEHIFRAAQKKYPAIVFQKEGGRLSEISWKELSQQVASLAAWLKDAGVVQGDRVVSFLPNTPEAIVAFLAANSLGAIWSGCSPDFGAASVVDRFRQIEPKVIFVADGYSYNGKKFDKKDENSAICNALPTLEKIVFIPYLNKRSKGDYLPNSVAWKETQERQNAKLKFTAVPFDHPLWVLYSSGTTGKPKAITHGTGGNLIEHLKALGLHQDCKPGDRFFWYSTTGWMMWNYALASMLHGATLCLYDGAPAYPRITALWDFARKAGVNHFGAGASYYIACMKEGLKLTNKKSAMPELRTIGSTGSPLPPEAFEWVYKHVKEDVWLISLSGGTDVCSGFVGGNPYDPVYKGEIQCRMLGCDLHAWNEKGEAVIDALGEMVITQPMPSMPIYFWGDDGNANYHGSYFDMFPGVWRHGDWIKITDRGSVIIFGRSDATLNRGGVRIGTSEIYSGLSGIPEVSDSIVVCIDREDGSHFMPLFVVLSKGKKLTEPLKKKIQTALRSAFSPRHVPDEIYAVPDVPYTISGKKMETPVRDLLSGRDISGSISKDAMKNPASLDFFYSFELPGEPEPATE